MTKAVTLTADDLSIMRAMSTMDEDGQEIGSYTVEEVCWPFAPLMRKTGLDRAVIRRRVRRLARLGFARYERALWSEDGEPRGAGYGITRAGLDELRRRIEA